VLCVRDGFRTSRGPVAVLAYAPVRQGRDERDPGTNDAGPSTSTRGRLPEAVTAHNIESNP
jgi:hypothetical protein